LKCNHGLKSSYFLRHSESKFSSGSIIIIITIIILGMKIITEGPNPMSTKEFPVDSTGTGEGKSIEI
jgi:hypothetical protein